MALMVVGVFLISGVPGVTVAGSIAPGVILPAGTPAAPTGLTITGKTYTSVNLSWVNPPGTLTHDTVVVFNNIRLSPFGFCGGNSVIQTDVYGVVTTAVIQNLAATTPYCFEVFATNSTGAGTGAFVNGATLAFTNPTWTKVGGQTPAPLDTGNTGFTTDPVYGNIYDSTIQGSQTSCGGNCLGAVFSNAKAALTNETTITTGQSMTVTWTLNAGYVAAGLALISIVVYEGVTIYDCSAFGAAHATVNDGGHPFTYTTNGIDPDMNYTGDSLPVFALNTVTGAKLIVNDTSNLNNGTWTFAHVPSETQFCIAMFDYKTGGGYPTPVSSGKLMAEDQIAAESPGWSALCSNQKPNTQPSCNAYGLQLLNITTSSVMFEWNYSGWINNLFNTSSTFSMHYAIYKWSNCSSLNVNATQTSGSLLFENSLPDSNCYISAALNLATVFSTSITGPSSFQIESQSGLTKNTEYAIEVWLTGNSPKRFCNSNNIQGENICATAFHASANVDFKTENNSAPVVPHNPVMTGLNLTAVTPHTFTVASHATRTTSLHLTLFALVSSDGIYTTPASQAPCTGYGQNFFVGAQNITTNGNTSITVGGPSSPVAGNNNLNGNATYCLSVAARNATAMGTYLNMTVYTNVTAGNSNAFTIFSTTTTSLTYQWYIGVSTTRVYLSVFLASMGGFASGAACVNGTVTFTNVLNVSLSSTLSPGLNRFTVNSLLTNRFYCASLGSYAGALLENILNVKGYTQTVTQPLVVTNLQITSSNATLITFSWANAASSTVISVYLSVWTLNVAFNTCNAAAVQNSTELSFYTTFFMGNSVTSYQLQTNGSRGLFTGSTYCIGVADSNNTLGLGPFTLGLATFTSGGGGGGTALALPSIPLIDRAIVGLVFVAIIVSVVYYSSRGPVSMHRR